MTTPANILICGKIRGRETFRTDIEVYRNWLANGQVARVVFSGWVSDLEENPDLIAELQQIGAELVLTSDPQLRLRGHLFHQMKALHYGLARFDVGDFVIKSRTDKIWLNFDPADAVRRTEEEAAGPCSPFDGRVLIVGGMAFHPFFFNDMLIAGRVGDLRRLVSFDLWYEAEGAVLNPEQAFHSEPVLTDRPFLRDFFLINAGLRHEDSDLADRLQRLLLTDSFYLRCLWDSLTTIRDAYRVGFSEQQAWIPPTDTVTLDDLAGGEVMDRVDGLTYASGAHSLVFTREEAIRFLLETPISATEQRSLADMFEGRGAATDRSGPLLDGEAWRLAEKLAEAFPAICPKPPAPGGILVHNQWFPYIIA